MTKVLISDRAHPILQRRLEEAGIETSVEPDHDYQSLLRAVQGYDGLVVRSKVNIDQAFLEQTPTLRCIGRLGAGMETIDTSYAEAHGIRCLNSPEGNRDAVGEHTVGLLLSLLNNISRADAEVRRGLWQREANRGLELSALTVGIIGFGNMGQAFAQRLQGFGCQVLAYDKRPLSASPLTHVRLVSLEEIKALSDIISLHVPLTQTTRHLVSDDFVRSVAHPFFLLNTSRGAVVDTEAIVRGLQEGKIRGAALDVLEYENMAADGLASDGIPEAVRYLWQSPHTVLTPHVAGWTVESRYKLADVLAEKIIKALQ